MGLICKNYIMEFKDLEIGQHFILDNVTLSKDIPRDLYIKGVENTAHHGGEVYPLIQSTKVLLVKI